MCYSLTSFFFFFNDTATTEIYTLSLHDALPICSGTIAPMHPKQLLDACAELVKRTRSEEHTSELQSPCNLVCRLLLEKKKNQYTDMLLILTALSCTTAAAYGANTVNIVSQQNRR